jgi:2,5-diketo-D-gluconate reductase A
MNRLGLEYLDLFLIHWPLPGAYDGDYVSTWRAMTELVGDGRLRSAGVSNFHAAHLERIVGETGLVPAVNQVEAHPYFANDRTREASVAHGIAVEAWSPLGQGEVLRDEALAEVGAAHGRTPAQVALRWAVQRGDIVFPKSMSRARMEENFALFDFELSAEEMATIGALDKGAPGRVGPDPDTFNWIPRS